MLYLLFFVVVFSIFPLPESAFLSLTYNITTFGGTGAADTAGDGGLVSKAHFQVADVCGFQNGFTYICDQTTIRAVNMATNVISRWAGNNASCTSGLHDGGQAVNGTLCAPITGMAFDSQGNAYIADQGTYRIRQVNGTTGVISTIGGFGSTTSSGNGFPATGAGVVPAGIAVNLATGNIYITEPVSNSVRYLHLLAGSQSTWIIDLAAGFPGGNGPSGLGSPGSTTKIGLPSGIAYDPLTQSVWVSDISMQCLYRIDTTNTVWETVGTCISNQFGSYQGENGKANFASVSSPRGITFSPTYPYHMYFADTGNNVIRMVNRTSNTIHLVAGIPVAAGFAGDGKSSLFARFSTPATVLFIDANNLLVGDRGNYRVRLLNNTNPPLLFPSSSSAVAFSSSAFPSSSAAPFSSSAAFSSSDAVASSSATFSSSETVPSSTASAWSSSVLYGVSSSGGAAGPPPTSTSSNLALIAGAAAAGAVVVLVLVLICYCCRRKRKTSTKDTADTAMQMLASNDKSCMECEAQVAAVRCDECDQNMCLDCSISLHKSGKRATHKLRTILGNKAAQIGYTELQLGDLVGEGFSAMVYQAIWRGTDVAVKMPKRTTTAVEEVKAEAEMSAAIGAHPRVIPYFGLSVEPSHPFLVFEFMPNGSVEELVNFKQAFVLYDVTDRTLLTNLIAILQIAYDSSSALIHLHKRNIIHRDVAARNFLANSQRRVFVADFGMSVILPANQDHIQFSEKEPVPIAWSAPEVLRQRIFSQASDVYAFGIYLLELVAQRPPYDGLTLDAIASGVVLSGLRPRIPGYCPCELAELMQKCWDADASARPTMEHINKSVKALLDHYSSAPTLEAVYQPLLPGGGGPEDRPNRPALASASSKAAYTRLAKEANRYDNYQAVKLINTSPAKVQVPTAYSASRVQVPTAYSASPVQVPNAYSASPVQVPSAYSSRISDRIVGKQLSSESRYAPPEDLE